MTTPKQINSRFFTAQSYAACAFAYSQSASLVQSADAVGINITTLRRRLNSDPEFKGMMEHAKAQYVLKLEAEAYRRAVTGTTQSKPGPAGTTYDVTTYSDTLLLHMLKKSDPEKHGDKVTVDQRITDERPIQLEKLKPEARDLLRQVLESAVDAEILAITPTSAVDSASDEPE